MADSPSTSKTTTDHDVIRAWAEERSGTPAIVRATENGSSGILRIDFRDPDDALDEIPWEEFFRIFDESDLAFLYQEETAEGRQSRFFKFIARGNAESDIDDETDNPDANEDSEDADDTDDGMENEHAEE